MPPRQTGDHITVMISSTMRDLRRERAAAFEAIRELGMTPWWAEQPPIVGVSPAEFCETMARECTLFILILGPNYGYRPDGQPAGAEDSITQMEYKWARRANPSKIIVLERVDAENTRDEQQRMFVDDVLHFKQGYTRFPSFRSPRQLKEQVEDALRGWLKRQGEGIRGYLRLFLERNKALGESLIQASVGSSVSQLLRVHTLENGLVPDPVIDTASNLLDYLERFIFIGDPGAGKTSFFRRLALELARDYLYPSFFSSPHIPVFVSLRELGAASNHFGADSLIPQEYVQIPNIVPEFEDALSHGQVVLLLDGLDEMTPPNRTTAIRSLDQYMNSNRSVISSRPRGIETLGASDWPVCEFQPLHVFQRRALIKQMVRNINRDRALDISPDVLIFEVEQQLGRWADNALFLMFIVEQYAYTGTINLPRV